MMSLCINIKNKIKTKDCETKISNPRDLTKYLES